MRIVNVTDASTGNTVRIDADRVVAYGPAQTGNGSTIMMDGSEMNLSVNETPTQLDSLIPPPLV